MRRFVALVFPLLLASLLGLSVGVSAHAQFVSSIPRPFDIWTYSPATVTVTLSEAVQPGSASIFATNLTNARVDRGPTAISPTDPATFSVAVPGIGPSVYTVTWSAVSADDGHFSAGTFYFIVRNRDGSLPGPFPQGSGAAPPEPVSPLEVALRALDFLGFSMAFGTLMFVVLIWGPARTDLGADEFTGPEDGERVLLGFARLGGIVFAGSVAAMWTLNLVVTPPATIAAVIGTAYLLSLATRLVLGGAFVALLSESLRRPSLNRDRGARPPELIAAVAVGLAAILADSFTTHSAIVESWWPVGPLVDATHLYGAALWVGGLLAVVRVRRWLIGPSPATFTTMILEAFSRFALLSVALVVGGGIVLSVLLVGSVGALVGTSYGWTVLAKVGLLVPMVVLGALNRKRLSPDAEPRATPAETSSVAKRIRVETILGIAVLVLAGLLTTLSPTALPAANPPFTQNATSDGLYAIFQVFPSPSGPGSYLFTLEVFTANNDSVYIGAANDSSTLTFTLLASGVPPITVSLQGPHGYNHFYYGPSDILSQPGTWEVDARLVRTNASAVDFQFKVPIHA